MTQKLTWKDYLVLGSLFFGMLFGAGNLIFPVHLGQLAGQHWLAAAGGFLLSGVLLPLMSFLALGLSKTSGLYELTKPLGKWVALPLILLVQLTIGPLLATPRTATVSYTIGIAPFLPAHWQGGGLLLYTGLFFGLTYLAMVQESKITALIGKYLNPLFLLILAVIFALAFSHPLGQAHHLAALGSYRPAAFANGFLQGYNTMDALAGLIFGMTIITAIHELGVTDRTAVSWATIKSGLIGMGSVAIIYLGLIWLGATSRAKFALGANGGITLAQVAHHYLGSLGDGLLAVLTILACITTAMGLVAAFAQALNQLFPHISYRTFLRLACGGSFLIANLGLDLIIAWSAPILTFLYPLVIALIVLGILTPWLGLDRTNFRLTVGLTALPAFLSLFKDLPPVLAHTAPIQALVTVASHWLPWYSLGFAWLPFTCLGLLLSGLLKLRRA